jgi:hypothetical protein
LVVLDHVDRNGRSNACLFHGSSVTSRFTVPPLMQGSPSLLQSLAVHRISEALGNAIWNVEQAIDVITYCR